MAKVTAKKDSKADSANSELPDIEAMQDRLLAVRSFALSPRHADAVKKMLALAALGDSMPQSLIFEGGTEEERLMASLFWAALLNCKEEDKEQGHALPCLDCTDCMRMVSTLHRDCFFLDGRSESIKIDTVREMRSVLGEPPREALWRTVIFCEAQSLGEASANALLKSLEEPKAKTSFVLLTPQRERLLATLVSRSWVLTLPWPLPGTGFANDGSISEVVAWGQAILQLTADGRGWMERTSRKGSLDKKMSLRVVLMCQQALSEAISKNAQGADSTPLAKAFASIHPIKQRMINEVLAECQESLEYAVNPAMVMDWLATRLYFLLKR